MKKKKIAFLYLDDIHMVYHFIGVVAELLKHSDKYDVEILTYYSEHKELFALCDLLGIDKAIIKPLKTRFYRHIREKLKNRRRPSPMYLMRKHKKLFLTYDALIMTDIKHEGVYDARKGNSPKFIYLGHGAGNREYPFINPVITKFDMILVASEKIIALHKRFFDYANTVFKIIGYPKKNIR